MNMSILFAASDLVGILKETKTTFGVDVQFLVSQIILFIIVALLLRKFAYHPILEVLQERRERIAESLTNVKRIKEELAKTEAARKEILQKAHAHATELIEEARQAANRLREEETQKAVAAAESVLAKAREAAAADHARMLSDLKREIGRLVVQTTARATGKILTGDDQRRLVEEANRELVA